MTYLDDVVQAYAECALWVGLDWDAVDDIDTHNPIPLDENYTLDDIADEAWDAIRGEVAAFLADNEADLEGLSAALVGYDFYLTRNRHGTGFWDRGFGARGERLTAAAHVCGEEELYVGDDGWLYHQ